MAGSSMSNADVNYLGLIQALPLFGGCAAHQLEALANTASYAVLGEGEPWHTTERTSGSHYVVLQGAIRVSMISPDGNEFIVAILARGEVLNGFLAGDATCPFLASSIMLTAHGPTIVMKFSWAKLALGVEALDLVKRFDYLLQECTATLLLRIEDLAMHSLDARLARILLRLHTQSTRIAELRLHRFNQSTLALLVNGSRSKVNQHLQRFVLCGAILLIDGCVRVIEKAHLLAIARGKY